MTGTDKPGDAIVEVTQADREDSGDVPWGYGWYDEGGKKHAIGYLPTVDYPRGDVETFPLYRHRLAATPSPAAQRTGASDAEAMREACARELENRAERARSAAIGGGMDPLDAQLLDYEYSNAAAAIRAIPSTPVQAPDSGARDQDDNEPADWAVAILRAVDEAYAAHMGDPNDDGFDDPSDAKRAAAFVIQRAFARAEAQPQVPAKPPLTDGEWFYPEGDHSSDECRFSPDEVIDYALEGENVSRVVCIERAASLPPVYAAVHVYTDAEKDERQSDDDYDYALFATHEEAKTALAAAPTLGDA